MKFESYDFPTPRSFHYSLFNKKKRRKKKIINRSSLVMVSGVCLAVRVMRIFPTGRRTAGPSTTDGS